MSEITKTNSSALEFISPLPMQTCIQLLHMMSRRKGFARASTQVKITAVDATYAEFYINHQSFVEAQGTLSAQSDTSTRVICEGRISLQNKIAIAVMLLISPLVIFNLATQRDPLVIVPEILWFVLLVGQIVLLPQMRRRLVERIQSTLS